jgi:hypothetical protein
MAGGVGYSWFTVDVVSEFVPEPDARDDRFDVFPTTGLVRRFSRSGSVVGSAGDGVLRVRLVGGQVVSLASPGELRTRPQGGQLRPQPHFAVHRPAPRAAAPAPLRVRQGVLRGLQRSGHVRPGDGGVVVSVAQGGITHPAHRAGEPVAVHRSGSIRPLSSQGQVRSITRSGTIVDRNTGGYVK